MIIRSICYFKMRGESRAVRVIGEKTEYNDVKGLREESGSKKFDHFIKIF